MRLSLKLSLLTAMSITLVLGSYGYFRVRREIELFESDIRRDHRMLGQSLAIAATSVSNQGAPDAAVRLIEDADTDQSHLTIRWLATGGDAPPSGIHPSSRIITEGDGGDRYLVTRVRVSLGALGPGEIEIRESLANEREYVRLTIIRHATAILVTISIYTFLSVLIGGLLLGRPLHSIMARVREIGRGELEGRIEVSGREMSELAQEINSMSERLVEAQERIEGETNARIAALEQLRHADRLTTIGKLASGVAHELGTPLTVVAARAKMIELGESQDAEIRDDARAIREQAERMTLIIRQLLDFSRRKRVDRQLEDVVALIRRTVGLLQMFARRHGVVLEQPATGEPLLAMVDAGQIEQVVTNLVMNAIQSQPSGGIVRLQVERRKDAGGEQVLLTVRDEGSGMSEETKVRIFEPFFTTKGVGEGTGLGLSVVYGIIQEHGGTIGVDSAPGEGTTITVCLPFA